MTVIRVDFEPAERDAMLQLMDIALKAQGLKVAEAVLILSKKLAHAPSFTPAVEVPKNEASEASPSDSSS